MKNPAVRPPREKSFLNLVAALRRDFFPLWGYLLTPFVVDYCVLIHTFNFLLVNAFIYLQVYSKTTLTNLYEAEI